MKFPIEPMLAVPTDPPRDGVWGWPFNSTRFLYELKWDGYRMTAQVASHGTTLWARSGRIINSEFPEIVEALDFAIAPAQRPVVLDGEIVWLDHSFPDLQKLQNRRKFTSEERGEHLKFMVFDCLLWQAEDLMNRRLDERRPYLYRLGNHPNLAISPASPDGRQFWEIVAAGNLEGLVAKPLDSTYRPGKRGPWLKIKHNLTETFHVVGYTSGEGTRSGVFGSLILARETNGELIYAGKTGTGFSVQSANTIHEILQHHLVDESPIVQRDIPRAMKHITTKREVTWVEPRYQALVEFEGLTKDGIPLKPAFKGLVS